MKGRLLGPTMTQYCRTSSKTGAGSWRWSKTGKAMMGALYGRVMNLRYIQVDSKNLGGLALRLRQQRSDVPDDRVVLLGRRPGVGTSLTPVVVHAGVLATFLEETRVWAVARRAGLDCHGKQSLRCKTALGLSAIEQSARC